MIKILNAVLAIIAGVGGALLLYWLLNKIADRLPGEVGGPLQAVGVHRAGRGRHRPVPHLPGPPDARPQLRQRGQHGAGSASATTLSCSTLRDFIFVTLLNTLLWIAVVPGRRRRHRALRGASWLTGSDRGRRRSPSR